MSIVIATDKRSEGIQTLFVYSYCKQTKNKEKLIVGKEQQN